LIGRFSTRKGKTVFDRKNINTSKQASLLYMLSGDVFMYDGHLICKEENKWTKRSTCPDDLDSNLSQKGNNKRVNSITPMQHLSGLKYWLGRYKTSQKLFVHLHELCISKDTCFCMVDGGDCAR
jgi:hypothetical protein